MLLAHRESLPLPIDPKVSEQSVTKCTINISDNGWSREIEVEADADGLYLEGPTIPWAWILKAHQEIQARFPEPAPTDERLATLERRVSLLFLLKFEGSKTSLDENLKRIENCDLDALVAKFKSELALIRQETAHADH